MLSLILKIIVVTLTSLPLTTCTSQDNSHRQVIKRLNYGVIIRPKQEIRILTDEWSHVFVVPLPVRNNFTLARLPSLDCSRDYNASISSCESLRPLFESLRLLHDTSVNRISATIEHMYELLPDSYVTRTERGIFDLGGQILNSLFGVATEKQLHALRATAIHSSNVHAHALDAWQKHANQLSSFMAISNKRFDNVANILKSQQSMVQHLHTATIQLDTDVAALKTLLTYAIVNITNFISVLCEVDDLRLAIEGLVHGQLSPLILPPAVIERTLISIHQALPKTMSSFASLVLEQLPADYYRTHNFVVTRQHHNLLLALRFPLTSTFNEHNTLYEFQTFPVPVPGIGNGDHVTEITGLPYGIAFDTMSPGSYYLLFQSKPNRIDYDFYYFSSSPSEPFRSFSLHDTCASALLLNDRQLIASLCKFHLRPMSLVPSIIPLTRSTILVTNISSLEYICDRRSVIHAGCLQCELTIPCHCRLQSPFILPERLVDCIPHDDNATVLHTVNLAVLQTFLQDSDLGSLLGDTLLHQPLPVSLPSFDIFRSKLSSQLARDHSLSYDLHRAVNATKQQDTVFHSLAESLWHDSQLLEMDSFTTSLRSYTDWYITWIFISVPLVICSLLGVLFLFYRVRVLAATVTAAHFTLHKVSALEPTLPSFLSYFSVLSPTNNSTLTVPLPSAVPCEMPYSVSLTLFLGTVFLLVLVFVKFGFCPFNPNSFTLILEFGQNGTIIPVATQLLPGSPIQYTFSSSAFIDTVTISGTLRPSLVVAWPTLTIYNHHLDMHFSLPKSITLGPVQAYRLRKLLRSSYWSMLTARCGPYVYRLDITCGHEPHSSAPKSLSPLSKPVTLMITSDDTGACSSSVLAPDPPRDSAQL